MAKFTEQYFAELPQVEDGVIKGAKLIGLTSRNNRRYEAKGLEKAAPLYEGRKVFVNHPTPESGGERSFGDWAGVIENVKYRKNSGLFGDVVLRQESSHYKGIVEVASSPKFRKSCGFSHVAEGESHYDGDTEIIEGITDVHSVDLVADPATTAGIFESKRNKTVKEAVEAIADKGLRKLLLEMVDVGSLDGSAQVEADDPQSQMYAIVTKVIDALVQMTKDKAVKETPAPLPGAMPEKLPAAGDDQNQGDPTAAGTSGASSDGDAKAAFEKMQRENAELKAKNLLLESGVAATPARVKALASVSDEAEQKELLESWPVVTEAGERPARSPALIESLAVDTAEFNTPEKFAARYR